MKILFYLLTIFIYFNGFCQELDYEIYNSNKIYTQSFVDSLIKSKRSIKVTELKKILESDSTLFGWTKYYARLTYIYSRERKFDTTVMYADLAINQFNNSKIKRPLDEQFLVNLYHIKGYALNQLKDNKNAILNYQKALRLSKTYPYKWISFTKTGIANTHLEIGNDSLALNYYLQVLNDSLYMNLPRPAITLLTKVGNLHNRFGDFEKAISNFNEGLELSYKTKYYSNIASLNAELAFSYHNKKDYETALLYFKKAINANKEYGLGEFLGAEMDNRFYKCYVTIFEGEVKKGIEDLKALIEDSKTIYKINKYDVEMIFSMIELLGIAYQKQHNYKEYQNLLIESFNLYERFIDEQQNEDLQNLETKYKTKEKEDSIILLEESQKQQNTIIKQQKTIAYGLGGLLTVFALFGGLFWRQRKLKNQYEKENLEQRLLRSQMNPHFIGNAMATVSALVEKKSTNAIPYINKLSNLFRLVLTNSREEFVSLEDELVTIKSYLELQSNFSSDFDFLITVDETIDKKELIIPPMLIQPFIENSIIHGIKQHEHRGKIDINMSKNENGLLLCEIIDNGVGYNERFKVNSSKNRKSISGDIIKERLHILKKKFKVNSRYVINGSQKGTKVSLYLPYLLDT